MDQEAVARLKEVLPHIRIAIEMAKIQEPKGTVFLAVGVKKPDGGGRLTAQFEEEFLGDVARVLGVFNQPGWAEPGPDSDGRKWIEGSKCPDCGSKQFECPSGTSCENGHGF